MEGEGGREGVALFSSLIGENDCCNDNCRDMSYKLRKCFEYLSSELYLVD